MGELPNVTMQILPLEAGAHPGMEGSFVLLWFPDDADPDTVYVTMATGGVFQEKAGRVALYSAIFDSPPATWRCRPDESIGLRRAAWQRSP